MPQNTVTAFLSLGSNLGEREAFLRRAAKLLSEKAGPILRSSSLFETAPVGFCSPNAFLNQAVAIETSLAPHELLVLTQEIEQLLGRTVKSVDGRYADRTIDIDLILYGDAIIDEPGLNVPHPRFRDRLFVLQPLAEIAGETIDPVTGKTISELLWAVS